MGTPIGNEVATGLTTIMNMARERKLPITGQIADSQKLPAGSKIGTAKTSNNFSGGTDVTVSYRKPGAKTDSSAVFSLPQTGAWTNISIDKGVVSGEQADGTKQSWDLIKEK